VKRYPTDEETRLWLGAGLHVAFFESGRSPDGVIHTIMVVKWMQSLIKWRACCMYEYCNDKLYKNRNVNCMTCIARTSNSIIDPRRLPYD